MIRSLTVLAAAVCFGAPVFAAEMPKITVEPAACVPKAANGVIYSKISPEVGGTEPRLYFRWDDHGSYYYVAMQAAGGGRYWAVPPKPIDENVNIEYYVDIVDAAGKSVARSMSYASPVSADCNVQLDPRQLGVAENLIVGETASPQINERVLGFLCDGIISRISPDGVLRSDMVCRRCVVAWWQDRQLIAPAAGLVTTGILIDKPESPSRPRP